MGWYSHAMHVYNQYSSCAVMLCMYIISTAAVQSCCHCHLHLAPAQPSLALSAQGYLFPSFSLHLRRKRLNTARLE